MGGPKKATESAAVCVHTLARFRTKRELTGGANRSGRLVRIQERCKLRPGHKGAHRTRDGREWA